jgi:hypothetical protein
MALASFMIELEFLGHIHDQHRHLGHVSRGLALLTRRGKTLIALSTLWQGNAEFEPSPASTPSIQEGTVSYIVAIESFLLAFKQGRER